MVPCVYDCASQHAVEMCGFPVSLLSGGEASVSLNGVIDYGFTNLSDLERLVARISQTSSIPLIADMDDGFGGPLAAYRSAKILARAGAAALQMEDGADMEHKERLLSREEYLAKVRAAVSALEGTDCLFIARTNADPNNNAEMKEGCERLKEAIDYGMAQGVYTLGMMVKVSDLDQARTMSKTVRGPKIFADVRSYRGENGRYHPVVSMEDLTPLGFQMCSTHYTLKAAMEGMLEHGMNNFREQGVSYTFEHAPATHIEGDSALPLFDPTAYMKKEAEFTGNWHEYMVSGHRMESYPDGFIRPEFEERI